MDSSTVEKWLKSVENTMALFERTNQERIRYVTYLFKLDVNIWWNLTKKIVKISKMTWTKFKKRFEAY